MKPDLFGDQLAQLHRWIIARGRGDMLMWLLVVSIFGMFVLVLLWDAWVIFWP